MKYTRYFAQLIKQHGAIQLQHDELRAYLNIIHLEAKIQVYIGLNGAHKYALNIRKIQGEIDNLSGKLDPKELIQRWIKGHSIKSGIIIEENVPWDENERYLVKPPKEKKSRRF
jgi:hypothetical protein